MAPEQTAFPNPVRFGDNFELDPRSYQLRQAGRSLKMKRIPMELLLLLVGQRGLLVTREQIIEKIWGKDVFPDADTSINSAIRKIRLVLKDDPSNHVSDKLSPGEGIALSLRSQKSPQHPPPLTQAL
jgi:DNA-binding response OmpR family regulator